MCAWVYFVELKYSQLKINHLKDRFSTKAAGGGIYSGVFDKDVKVPVKVTWLSSLVPLLPTIWSTLATNKFGRLAQGVGGGVKGTNTIFFIRKDQVPKHRIKDATHGSYGCEIKPNKKEKHCT